MTTLYQPTTYQQAYNVLLSLSVDPNVEDEKLVNQCITAACYGVPDSPESADTIDFCKVLVAKVRCSSCDERTLSVDTYEDRDAAALRLCLPCYDEAGLENEHSDGHHDQGCPEGCPSKD